MRKAIDKLNECLKSSKNHPVLLMLSGGSSLELLAGIEMRNIGKNVTITVLDERYSSDPAVNNFSQIEATEFYGKAEKRGIDYIDTSIRAGDTPKKLAQRFEKRLRSWIRRNPKGRIIVTQGIGPDGHTAGIMPFPENPKRFQKLFNQGRSWVISYNATKEKTPYPFRITVTYNFLREQVDCAVAYATGKQKKRAVKKLVAKKGSEADTPSRILLEMEDASLFTDQL